MHRLHAILSLGVLASMACGGSSRPIPRREPPSGGAETTSAAITRKDPFEGAPPYAAGLPDGRAVTTHANGQVGVVPNLKAKCLSCHGKGGDADAPRFLFAGSIYQSKEATTGAMDMELGVIDASGKELLVHSDQDGNFWAMGTQTMTYPAFAAVRRGASTKPMKKKINDAGELECNSCHDSSNPILGP